MVAKRRDDAAFSVHPAAHAVTLLFACSHKLAYGVNFGEEIKGHGTIEYITQKWPVVRSAVRWFAYPR